MPVKYASGSYNPNALPGDFTTEFHRLEAQVELSWDKELASLRQAGLRDGMRILDVGCGPGFVAELLLSAFPTIEILAVDVLPEMIEAARRRITNPRIRFQTASLDMLAGEAKADWVIARYLLQHLADPAGAIHSLLALVQPHGGLSVIDVDGALWGMVHPTIPELERIYRKADLAQMKHCGNRAMGRKLWRMLRGAGASSVSLDIFAYHSDELGVEAFDSQLSPLRLTPALAQGAITLEEYSEACLAYAAWKRSPDPYVLMLGFAAHARVGLEL